MDAPQSQIGVAGDDAHIEGGIHFHTHTTPTGKPLERPPRAAYFTDREADLAQLLADLQPGQVVTLCGSGGIGKTALAAEVVWSLAPKNETPERFPDGVVFHSFYGQPQVDQALEKIVYAFGDEPKPTAKAAALRVLGDKQALLLLDGTEDADNLGSILEVRGNCGVLVTSRQRKDALADWLDIRPLVIEEAVKLLRKWGGDQAADEIATRRICELVDGLPLAVRLVGRYLNQTPETAATYLKWLEATPLEALDPDLEQHRLESVPWLLARSLKQVSQQARDVLALVGLLALDPFSEAVVEKVLQLDIGQLKRALRQLTGYGLPKPTQDQKVEKQLWKKKSRRSRPTKTKSYCTLHKRC